jgi:AcrR family transcriptional regulator
MPAQPALNSAGQSAVPEARDGTPGAGARRRYAPRMAPAERREQLIDAALEVILEQGYSGVSIEAIARRAGVTRPVVYDHFPNLGRLLHTLVEREERISVGQLEQVVPEDPGDRDPIEVLAGGVRRFLEAVASRPATWRIILLPLEGTPQVVRDHVETNRARTQARIANIVGWALKRSQLPDDLDVELTARAIRVLSEDAGRTLLTDPESYPPERYERFVRQVLALVLPPGS